MCKIRFLLLLFAVFFTSTESKAKFNIGAQGSFMHFFGDTKLHHFGGGVKLEYVYNEWASVYGMANIFQKNEYLGAVEAEARGDLTRPVLLDFMVPSEVFFTQIGVGAKVYFYGELDPVIEGGFGCYGLGEFSLMIGSSESLVEPGPEYDAYYVPVEGKVQGTFFNYTASLGLGAEKQIGRPFLFLEAKFNLKIDEANAFSVKTRIPYGMSYFVGIRFPLQPE